MELARQYHICLKLELQGKLLKEYPLNQHEELMFEQYFNYRDVVFMGGPQTSIYWIAERQASVFSKS